MAIVEPQNRSDTFDMQRNPYASAQTRMALKRTAAEHQKPLCGCMHAKFFHEARCALLNCFTPHPWHPRHACRHDRHTWVAMKQHANLHAIGMQCMRTFCMCTKLRLHALHVVCCAACRMHACRRTACRRTHAAEPAMRLQVQTPCVRTYRHQETTNELCHLAASRGQLVSHLQDFARHSIHRHRPCPRTGLVPGPDVAAEPDHILALLG